MGNESPGSDILHEAERVPSHWPSGTGDSGVPKGKAGMQEGSNVRGQPVSGGAGLLRAFPPVRRGKWKGACLPWVVHSEWHHGRIDPPYPRMLPCPRMLPSSRMLPCLRMFPTPGCSPAPGSSPVLPAGETVEGAGSFLLRV